MELQWIRRLWLITRNLNFSILKSTTMLLGITGIIANMQIWCIQTLFACLGQNIIKGNHHTLLYLYARTSHQRARLAFQASVK